MDLRTKLQLKGAQAIDVVGAPATFALDLGTGPTDDAALLVFATDRAALDQHRSTIVAAGRADRLAWVAYPKAGQLGTDLNRDSLAATLADDGVRAVRQIALDDVWSALRFRPA